MNGIVLAVGRSIRPAEAPPSLVLGKVAPGRVDASGEAQGEGWWLGVRQWWSTPEEVGERQPLHDGATDTWVAVDGRLDNRDDLCLALGLGKYPRLSDAAVVLAAWGRWREEAFARLVGPFAIVLVEGGGRRVICARDHLGERTLVYTHRGDSLLIASEECALLAHPAVSDRLNERTVARFLAVLPPAVGETFFEDIREIPPAHLLLADEEGLRVRRFWKADLSPLPQRRDEDFGEEFRSLLELAVRCCLRSPSRPAILMSGGLDSTSVAALAARAEGAFRPAAVSWVFDEIPGADERPFMEPLIKRYNLEWIRVFGDDLWPLCPRVPWGTNPNGPGEAPSKGLWMESAAALAARGLRLVLTGESGDQLYFGSGSWLRETLQAGRFWLALRGVAGAALAGVFSEGRELRRLRSAVAQALGLGPRPRSGAPLRRWLTPAAMALVAESWPPSDGEAPSPRRLGLEDPWNRWGLVEGYRGGRALGLEVRRPYRDWRLATFAARLPAYLLYRDGWSKWILRKAMAGILPENVRRRRWRSSHLPWVARGLAERGFEGAREVLGSPDAVWPRYVDRRSLFETFPANLRAGRDGAETVVAWQCIALEMWRQARTRGLLGLEGLMVGKREEKRCA